MARLDQGKIVFNNSSSLSSAGAIYYNQINGHPTNLTKFTNNLGNYGGWATSSNFAAGITNSFGRSAGSSTWGMNYDGTNIYISCYNCACHCNC